MALFSFLIVSVVGAIILSTGVGASLLPCLGFGVAGPLAGSMAAGAQAFVGNVAAGSIFAGLQALAMSACTP